MDTDQEQKVVVNFLVNHFLRMQRILATLASSSLIRIGGGDLLFELNLIYIHAHGEFFRILDFKDDKGDFDELRRVAHEHGFEHFNTLEKFSEWHDLGLLSDQIRDEIDPIAGEITRIAAKYGIRRNTYYGVDVVSTSDERIITTGVMIEKLGKQGLCDEDYQEQLRSILGATEGIT